MAYLFLPFKYGYKKVLNCICGLCFYQIALVWGSLQTVSSVKTVLSCLKEQGGEEAASTTGRIFCPVGYILFVSACHCLSALSSSNHRKKRKRKVPSGRLEPDFLSGNLAGQLKYVRVYSENQGVKENALSLVSLRE